MSTEDGMIQDRRQAVTKPVPASRVVSKPIPQAQTKDPREFQLGQIRRRFSPKETKHADGGALLKFNLAPSDPDFPFEMTTLECLLSVPVKYPKSRPTLKVGNKDIPRGFALNVEAGFDGLAGDKPDASLLELMKALDKNLETFLSAPKADTVKLVPNKDTRHLSALPSRSVEPPVATTDIKVNDQHATPTSAKHVETLTAEQKAEALKKRESETRQLEARMGRLPLYKKSGDGIAYMLPLEPRRRAELPVALQAVKTVQLFVPLLYPLQPCRIGFEGVDSEVSKGIIYGFEQKSTEKKETTLMGHVNFLAQNMHILAKTPLEPKAPVVQPAPSLTAVAPESVDKGKSVEGQQDPDRSHIQYITRPPEWTVIDAEDLSGTDTDDLYSYDTEEETSDDEGGVGVKAAGEPEPSQQPTQNPERGTAISFPFIELYGIELLEVVVLNITVKCERCKDVTEIKGLKNGISKSESCRKCASQLSITFRRDLVHAHAVRAGFLDFEGCIVGDMLPRYALLSLKPMQSLTSSAHLSPPALNAQPPTHHQASSASKAKQPATSAGNATKNSLSRSRKLNSCVSLPPTASLPPPVRAERKKLSVSKRAQNSLNAAAVDIIQRVIDGLGLVVVRRFMRVISVMMRKRSIRMSGRIA
jgi:hypothetical protein